MSFQKLNLFYNPLYSFTEIRNVNVIMKYGNIKMYGSAIINTLWILPANTRWQDTCQAGWGWWTDISISRVKICLQFQNRPSLYKTHCLVAFFSMLDWSEPSSRSPGVSPQTEPCIEWITQTNKSVQSACKPACMHRSAAFIVKFSKLLLIQVKYFPFTWFKKKSINTAFHNCCSFSNWYIL